MRMTTAGEQSEAPFKSFFFYKGRQVECQDFLLLFFSFLFHKNMSAEYEGAIGIDLGTT